MTAAPALDFLLPQLPRRGQGALVIAIGCTVPAPLGGDRRALAERYRDDEDLDGRSRIATSTASRSP